MKEKIGVQKSETQYHESINCREDPGNTIRTNGKEWYFPLFFFFLLIFSSLLYPYFILFYLIIPDLCSFLINESIKRTKSKSNQTGDGNPGGGDHRVTRARRKMYTNQRPTGETSRAIHPGGFPTRELGPYPGYIKLYYIISQYGNRVTDYTGYAMVTGQGLCTYCSRR